LRGRIAAKSLSNASATTERHLTGADFDIESIQFFGENFWFGDEFCPYLIRADCSGRVTGVFETRVIGQLLRSPDHYTVNAPAVPGAFEMPVRRSRGFEGMAASPDGRFPYPMLEGPVWDALAKAWESRHGKQTLRILEFDAQQDACTGRTLRYALEVAGNSIGDFNMIDKDMALVIERDNGAVVLPQEVQAVSRIAPHQVAGGAEEHHPLRKPRADVGGDLARGVAFRRPVGGPSVGLPTASPTYLAAFLAAGFGAVFTATFFATDCLTAAFLATRGFTATFFGAAAWVLAKTAFFSAAASFSMALCRALDLRSAPSCKAASFLPVLRLVASSFFSAALTDFSADAPAFDSWAWAFASCFSAAFTRPPILACISAPCFITLFLALPMLADTAPPMASNLCDTAVPTSLAAVPRCAPAVASSDFLVVLRVAMFFLWV